jgi:hypothetical protein
MEVWSDNNQVNSEWEMQLSQNSFALGHVCVKASTILSSIYFMYRILTIVDKNKVIKGHCFSSTRAWNFKTG